MISSPSFAADAVVKEKLIVQGNVVALKDGGTIVVDKDGVKYLHKNDVIWKQITEKGTLAPNR